MKINKDFIKETGDLVVDSIRTKNLFDKNRLWNAWINAQGNLVESASNRASDYIDVHSLDYITISGSTSDAVIEAFYNSSKTFVSYVEVSSSSITLQVPNNAYYLRVTLKPSAVDTYQIEEGSIATSYRPHQDLHLGLATQSSNGLMSASDKTTIDNLGNTYQSKILDNRMAWPGAANKITLPVVNYGFYLIISVTPFNNFSMYILGTHSGQLHYNKVAGDFDTAFSLSGNELTLTLSQSGYWISFALYLGRA